MCKLFNKWKEKRRHNSYQFMPAYGKSVVRIELLVDVFVMLVI